MDDRGEELESNSYNNLLAEERKQVKNDALARALRDNLRRRKIASKPYSEEDGGGLSS